jgi:hypothetical protein
MSIFSSRRELELETELALAEAENKELKKAERAAKREANTAAKKKILALQEEIEAVKKANTKQTEELMDSKDKEVKKVTTENEGLKTKIEALEEAAEASIDIHKRTIILEKKEAMFEAQEEANKTLAKQFKELKDDTETAKQAEYTKGYADGLSDGIRKGIDASQEDRKHLAQVAMVAAASHTPAAAEIVAQEFKNALPATTSRTNK